MKAVSDKNKLYLITGVVTFMSCLIIANIHENMIFGIIPMEMMKGIACVGAGILLHAITKIGKYSANIWYTLLEAFLIVWTVLILFYTPMALPYWTYRVILYSVLIYLFLVRRGHITQVLDKPIFSKLSQFSLSMFLTHFFLTKTSFTFGTLWFINRYRPIWMENDKALVIALVLLSAVVVAVFAHYFVEKPCTRLLRKVLK